MRFRSIFSAWFSASPHSSNWWLSDSGRKLLDETNPEEFTSNSIKLSLGPIFILLQQISDSLGIICSDHGLIRHNNACNVSKKAFLGSGVLEEERAVPSLIIGSQTLDTTIESQNDHYWS